MRRAAIGLCLATSLLACDEEPPKTLPTAAPAPTEGLNIDDKHYEPRAVLAVGTEGESSWRLTVATDVVSCDTLKRTYPGREEATPGTRVDVWLRRPMNADGSLGDWSVHSAHITDGKSSRGMTTRGAMLEAVAESKDQVKVVGLDLACSDGEHMVTFTGAVTAKNCGRVPLPGDGTPLDELTVIVATKRYPVHGATLRPFGKRFHLRLSRAPHDCNSDFAEGFDSYVDVVLEGDPPRVALASLQGDAFPDSPSGSKGKDSFRVETKQKLSDSEPFEVALAGKLDLTGYALEIEGKVKAQRCPAEK